MTFSTMAITQEAIEDSWSNDIHYLTKVLIKKFEHIVVLFEKLSIYFFKDLKVVFNLHVNVHCTFVLSNHFILFLILFHLKMRLKYRQDNSMQKSIFK